MTRRGGEGKYGRLRVLHTGPRAYLVQDRLGNPVGTVERKRHTVRTAYAGTRIGYDRTHWCWHALDFRHHGQYDERLYCFRTLADVVRVMDRLWHDAS